MIGLAFALGGARDRPGAGDLGLPLLALVVLVAASIWLISGRIANRSGASSPWASRTTVGVLFALGVVAGAIGAQWLTGSPHR